MTPFEEAILDENPIQCYEKTLVESLWVWV